MGEAIGSRSSRRRGFWAAPSLLLALALGACVSTPQTDALLEAPPPDLPRQVVIDDVPFIAQEDLWCGPASMAMAMTWSGLPVTQEEMAEQVYTPGKEGTLTTDMVAAARRNGRLAVEVDTLEAVLGELAAGHPVIVFQNLALDFYPQWHYAVAYGYDLDQGTITLHSGTEAERITRLGTFELTWARADNWALLVLPPDVLPATSPEVDVAQAAAGIERAGQRAAAETAYRTMLERWPDSGTAWLGLGNLAYGAGDVAAAEAHYRRATEADPEMGAAWNNLAVTLDELGDPAAARAAVEQAIALNDGNTATYQATLAEIGE